MTARFFLAGQQQFDENGDPLAGAKLYFFTRGSTVAELDTYSDSDLTTPNANPIIADSSGYFPTSIFVDSEREYNVILIKATGSLESPFKQWDDWSYLTNAHTDTDLEDQILQDVFRQVSQQDHIPYPDRTAEVIIDGRIDHFHYHSPSIVQGKDGKYHLVYRKSIAHGIGNFWRLAYKSSYDLLNWSDEVILVAAVAGSDFSPGGIGILSNGRIVICYNEVKSAEAIFYSIITDDNGTTFSDPIEFDRIAFAYARLYGRLKRIPTGDPDNPYKLFVGGYKRTGASTYAMIWYDTYDGETFSDANIIDETTDNEYEVFWGDSLNAVAVVRTSIAAANQYATTDGGTTWTLIGSISPGSDRGFVAPSLDGFMYNSTLYLLLGWCDRRGGAIRDEDRWGVIPFQTALTSTAEWELFEGDSFDLDNASGYQTTITDLNGMIDIEKGIPSIHVREFNAAYIKNITQANPAVVTTHADHEFEDDDFVYINLIQSGMTQINGMEGEVTVLSPTTFSVDINTTSFTAYDTSWYADITGITAANPAVVTTNAAHGFSNGQSVVFYYVEGMTQINALVGTVTVLTPTTFSVNIDASAFTAYTSGGMVFKGDAVGDITQGGVAYRRVSQLRYNLYNLFQRWKPVFDAGIRAKAVDNEINTYPVEIINHSGTHALDIGAYGQRNNRLNAGPIDFISELTGRYIHQAASNSTTDYVAGYRNAAESVLSAHGAYGFSNKLGSATTIDYFHDIGGKFQINTEGSRTYKFGTSGLTFNNGTDYFDYLKTTFTPVLTSAAGTPPASVTYTAQVGRATVEGNRVFGTVYMIVTGYTGSPTGVPALSGFPYTVVNVIGARTGASLTKHPLTTGFNVSAVSNAVGMTGYFPHNDTVFHLYRQMKDGTASAATWSDISSGSGFTLYFDFMIERA